MTEKHDCTRTLVGLREAKRGKYIQESENIIIRYRNIQVSKSIIYTNAVTLLQPLRIALFVAAERSPETLPTNPEFAHAWLASHIMTPPKLENWVQ